MSVSKLINEILTEWAYRVDDGMPNPNNSEHLQELENVLSEMGLSSIKSELIKNLNEAEEGNFKNPALNKKVKYKNTKGEDAEGIVGNLLRLPKEHPGRKAAEATLPKDGTPERDAINKDLGGEGQPAKPEDEKGKEGGEDKGGEEDKAAAAQAMFDPKNDPAMAARLDKEKETQAKLAADAEKEKEAEKPADAETPTAEKPAETPTDTETPAEKPADSEKKPKKKQKQVKDASADEAEDVGPSTLHKGKVHLGGGYYAEEGSDVPTSKFTDGKLVPLPKEQSDYITQKGVNLRVLGSLDKVIRDGGKSVEDAINDTNLNQKIKDDLVKYYKEKQAQPKKDKAKETKPSSTKDVANNLKDRKTSDGEPLDLETTDNGSIIVGVEHGANKQSTQDTIKQITSLPKDTKVMFVGEGGMGKDDAGKIEFAEEQSEIRDAVKNHFTNSSESSWDENANVYDDNSPIFGAVGDALGGSKSKARAAIWSNMVGQDQSDMNADDYLDDEGKAWLVSQAKAGGSAEFDGEVDWNNLTDGQKKDLYQLNYRDDQNYGETEISKAQEAYNGFRQKELDRKIKEAEAEGYKVIAPVGNSHVDMWRQRNKVEPQTVEPKAGEEPTGPEGGPDAEPPKQEPAKPDTTAPAEPKAGEAPTTEPKAAEPTTEPEDKEDIKDEKPGQEAQSDSGKKIYSIGGGYYSDKPNGPAKYVRTEWVVDLAFSDIITEDVFALFEKTITATLSNGKQIKVQELPPRARQNATAKARAVVRSQQSKEKELQKAKGQQAPEENPTQQTQEPVGQEKPAAQPKQEPVKKEKPPIGVAQGEFKSDPNLKPPADKDGEIPGTDIPVNNEEKPNPKFVNKISTKMDDFYKDVLDAEQKAQDEVIDQMKKEGKLPEDFKGVPAREMGFGFKHPALSDNPELQKEMGDRIKKANKPPHWNLCKVSIPGTNKFCDENIGIPREKMPQLGGKPKPGSEGELKAKKVADQNVRKKMGLPAEGEVPADRQKEYNDLYAKENTQHVNVEKEFEDYLKSEGINVSEPMEVPASSLKATQSELVGEQVVGMVAALEEDPNNPFITAPIMVTRDGYVIDGHHRWATIQAYNMKHTPPNGNKPPIKMKVRVVDEDIDTHIPRANSFAERMGIETMSGKAKGDEPKQATSAKPALMQRIKDKIKKWTQSEREYFNDGYYKPGSKPRRTLGEALMDKVKGGWQAFKDGLQHEVHLFKEAGHGLANFFSGKEVNAEQKKALISVAKKIAITALTSVGIGAIGAAAGAIGTGVGLSGVGGAAASGAAQAFSHGALAFAKHVAIELVPHIVGETLLAGAGRAAIFADFFGEAESDANMQKFMLIVAEGIQNMKISAKLMDEFIDSYEEKKAKGEIDVKEESKVKNMNLIDELIEEVLNEAKPKNEDPDVTYTPVGKNGKPGKPTTIKYSSAIKYDKKHPAYIAAMKLKDKEKKSDTTPQVKGAGLFADPEYQKRMSGEKQPEPKSSDSEENVEGLYDPSDKLQSSVVQAKNTNELFNALDELGKDEQDLMLDKVKAGAGGPVASTGETLCTEAQTDLIQGRYKQKEIRASKEYKDSLSKVYSVYNGTDKRAQKGLVKELDNICDKMGYYDESGKPDYELAMRMKAEADLYIDQNLDDFKNTTVARTKFKKEEDMVSWMKASFYSSYSLLNNGPADWDRKRGNGRVMKANGRTDGVTKQVLLDGAKNAKTPEEKAHYEQQLKVWEKFKGYHDTYMVYKNDKGFLSVYHISNKKSDDLDDPQNNTTPETRLANYMAAAREAKLSPKAAKAVNDAQSVAMAGSADNDNIAKSAWNEIGEEANLVASLSNRLPSRSQTDVKDEYYTDLKNDKMIKDWYKKKYGDKWQAKYKAAKSSEVVGVAMEIAGNVGDISKLSGNFTKFLLKQGQLAQSIFAKAESGMTAKEISQSFKGIYSAKEIQSILGSNTMKMLADRKAQHAAGLEGVHKGFITSLHKADGTKPGDSGKNGPAVETYVAGTLKSLHIDTYVTNFDDSVQIEMGGVGCTPKDVRGCMANLSGFSGDTNTTEGRAALNKHLAETVKVDADSDAVYLLGNDGKTRTYLASDTWRQAGSSKKIATGFGSNLRKCLKGSVGKRLAGKRNQK